MIGVIPASYSILENKVPNGLPNIDQIKKIENIYQEFSSENILCLNFSQTLLDHQQEEIYYHTDHHWTTLGAYYAYLEFCNQLKLSPMELSDFSQIEVPDFYGTFFSRAKLQWAKPDTIFYYEIPVKKVVVDGQEKNGLYQTAQFQKRDKYAAFLYGNNGLTTIYSDVSEERKGSKILVIKDSYGNSFIPYLTQNYEEVHVIDLRYFSLNLFEYLEDNSFDTILFLYSFQNFSQDKNLIKLCD